MVDAPIMVVSEISTLYSLDRDFFAISSYESEII